MKDSKLTLYQVMHLYSSMLPGVGEKKNGVLELDNLLRIWQKSGPFQGRERYICCVQEAWCLQRLLLRGAERVRWDCPPPAQWPQSVTPQSRKPQLSPEVPMPWPYCHHSMMTNIKAEGRTHQGHRTSFSPHKSYLRTVLMFCPVRREKVP